MGRELTLDLYLLRRAPAPLAGFQHHRVAARIQSRHVSDDQAALGVQRLPASVALGGPRERRSWLLAGLHALGTKKWKEPHPGFWGLAGAHRLLRSRGPETQRRAAPTRQSRC